MNLEKLFEDVKNYLDITWDDDDTNRNIKGIVSRGMDYLDNAAGGKQDFEKESGARALLFEYAMYVNSGALSEFQQNYLPELLSLQMHQEVKMHEEEKNPDIQ